jgi:hypothetical protein
LFIVILNSYGKPGGCGFMDISANGAWRAWGGTNPISAIPEPTAERPVAVFMKNAKGVVSHIGLYVGTVNGKRMAVESTPPKLKMAELGSRPWCGWAYVPRKWLTWADSYFGDKDTPAPPCPLIPDSCPLKMGDRVRIKTYGVPYYPGGAEIPDEAWLRGMVMTVNGLDLDGNRHGGAPCARLQEITSWCACENLEKVEE